MFHPSYRGRMGQDPEEGEPDVIPPYMFPQPTELPMS